MYNSDETHSRASKLRAKLSKHINRQTYIHLPETSIGVLYRNVYISQPWLIGNVCLEDVSFRRGFELFLQWLNLNFKEQRKRN